MTTRDLSTEPAFSVSAFTSDERDRLTLLPDEEQRSVLYRDLLSDKGIDQPTNLAVAENVLLYPMMRAEVFDKMPVLPKEYVKYFPSYGSVELRTMMAARLAESFGVPGQITPDEVFGVAGVSSALQCIAWGLQTPLSVETDVPMPRGDQPCPVPPGSTVMLPAPFWQGFYWSFQQGPNLKCLPVPLTTAGIDNFRLTLDDLRREYDARPEKPKLLVLTNPQNPLGVNYDRQLLESTYEWALQHTDMHIISDEMYCHSQLSNAKPPFVSALALNAIEQYRDRVHVVWGFAKDFGLSGFRAGFLISRSPYVRNVMVGATNPTERRNAQSWFTPMDSLKHFYLLNLLHANNDRFWHDAMRQYPELLTSAYKSVAGVLDRYRIRHVHTEHANSAQFFWLDLREFLGRPDQSTTQSGLFGFFGGDTQPDPEQHLADAILRNANVQLLTGTTLSCPVKGYFRLCFTATETDQVVKAVTAMCEYLRSLQ
ncbi:pyridoxal phosphate-dependent aminotransferase [Actinokineospora iranica]|uniref:Aminotransferase n=1 Tax=Actinokineospora iranica TaxID=1271860 RepID=A0A1G6SVQ5_9PSEU|nr:pyridoxal phosphate-dependent aminotransferase [Actinokineospora iranica]SDD21030.1 Aspartate/methionine/tyrosine aminotransferase [Actinokineospora iranica]